MIKDTKKFTGAWSAASHIVFENVRVPITEHVLTYECGKVLGGFADIAGIKARTLKSIRHFAKRYCKSIDMKLVLLKSAFFWVWTMLSLVESVRVWYTSFYVRAD